jgi:phosphoglycolate phosphatase-like HAD superfamily hydrolase
MLKSVLALDFDGVLCNGLNEYFAVSAQVYRELCPDIGCTSHLEPFRAWFYRLRPVVTHGWEMPVLLHGLVEGEDPEEMEITWPQVQKRLLAATGWTAQELGQAVDRVRDAWIERDEPGWLALHEFYGGVVAQVQGWLTAAPFQPVIVTTKQERFVQALFHGVGIPWPSQWLYGKTVAQPKTAILQTLHQQYGVSGFVEDRWEALAAVRQVPTLQNVPLYLATWGYTTPHQVQLAAQVGIQPLTLAEFCDPLYLW